MKNNLKRIIAAALCGAITLSMSVPVSAEEHFESARETADSIRIGWNLGNTLDCTGDWIADSTANKPADYEKAWGNPVTTAAMLKAVKAAGFNAVRVPITYDKHIGADGKIDKAWLDRVQEIVDYVFEQDMYCIINVHHDTGTDGWLKASAANYDTSSVRFASIWSQVAERFGGYSDKLLFEGFNEIVDDNNNWGKSDKSSYEAVNKLNSLFVATVRSSGKNNSERNLIVNTYAAGSSEDSLSNFELPADKAEGHILAEVHNYDPQGFCGTPDWTKQYDNWDASFTAQLDRMFLTVKKYSDKLGVPFIIGEFGAVTKDNDGERAKYAEYFVDAAKKYGIKCFWWDDGGSFKLLDRTAGRFIHTEVVDALIKAAPKAAEKPEAAAGKTVRLSWDSTEGADVYRVYRYDSTLKNYVRVSTVSGCSLTLKNQTAGTYRYRIYAAVKSGNGYKNKSIVKTTTVKVK